MIVTLAEAKKHLIIDSTYTDDDTYISSLIEAAECAVEQHTRVELKADTMTKTLKQAVLLLVGHWYLNREAVTTGTAMSMPLAFDYLVDLNYKYDGWC